MPCFSQVHSSFIDEMNQNMACRTPGCNGTFVPIRAISEGLGGPIKIVIVCNGCKMRTLTFDSSPLVESSRRTMVGVALQVASAILSHSSTNFRHFRRYVQVNRIIWCDEAREDMYKLGSDYLGSYHHAVTTGDGTWLTRGFFSQNHTSSNSYYPDETKTPCYALW